MNSFLLWIGGLLVAVLCALFAGPHFVDWNRYRGVFEEEASRALGREVRVGGRVDLRLLPTPYVMLEKVRIADKVGGTGEAFFRADGLRVRLSIAPLLTGTLAASEIELNGPMLRLAVDGDGLPNWQNFQLAAGAPAYLPRGVALQNIHLRRGTIVLAGPDAEELIRFEGIDGEVGATALEGPYKARATFNWRGEQREMRISTAAQDPDGGLRFKLSVKSPRTAQTYTLDGRLADLAVKPRLDGELTARLPLAASKTAAGAPEPVAAEVRARLAMDGFGARLTEMLVNFDSDGRPQHLEGTLDANWRGHTVVRTALASRWLDLDRIGATGSAASPLVGGVQALAEALSATDMPGTWQAAVTVDQATLGGEAIGAVQLVMARAGGHTRVHSLKATLPGGTRIDAKGSLLPSGGKTGFDGELDVRGASLQRFAGWAGRGFALADARAEGPFSLEARIKLVAAGIELNSARVEYGGTRFTGSTSYYWDGRPRLQLALDGNTIDIGAFMPGMLSLGALRKQLWPPATSAPARSFDPSATDLWIKARAGQLSDGERVLAQVDADLGIEAGVLKITRLRFLTPRGLGVDVDGEVKDVIGRPKGDLAATFDVTGTTALADLAELAGAAALPTGDMAERLAPLTPARLAGVARIGRRGERAVDISADGTIPGGRLTSLLRLDGGLRAPGAAPLEATLAVEADDLTTLIALAGRNPMAPRPKAAPLPGRLMIKASGTPDLGMATFAEAEGEGFAVALGGRLEGPTGTSDFAGELRIRATDAGRLLPLAGFAPMSAAQRLAVEGVAVLAGSRTNLRIEPRALYLGGSLVSGTISIAGPEHSRRLDARLSATEASLPHLLTILAEGSETAGEANSWSARPFQPAILTETGGTLRLEIGRLQIDRGLSLTESVLTADLAPRTVRVTSLRGNALGGRVDVKGTLALQSAGADLALDVTLTGAHLDQLGGGEPPSATGRANATFMLTGRGTSARALVGALTGKGEVELREASASRLAPDAVDRTADLFLADRISAGQEELRRAMTSETARAPLALGNRRVGFELANGILQSRPLVIDLPQARLTNRTVIELAGFKVDSEWRLEPKTPRPAGKNQRTPLPPATIIYSGPLGDLQSLQMHFAVDALEQDLAIRKLEQDVEELERLRKLDEERSRSESDRARALEAAAQAAATHAAAGQSGDTVTDGSPTPPDLQTVVPPRPQPAVRPPAPSSPRFDPFAIPSPR